MKTFDQISSKTKIKICNNSNISLFISRPVRIENFPEHYRIMSADSDFRFSEEFDDLKSVGRDQAITVADLPCNRPKNRFTNILPYDNSRYKLQPVDDEEGSDYINANYVPVQIFIKNFLKQSRSNLIIFTKILFETFLFVFLMI